MWVIGIRNGVGINIVILRREVVSWRCIVPRHFLSGLEGLRDDGAVAMIVGDGKLTGIGSTSFELSRATRDL